MAVVKNDVILQLCGRQRSQFMTHYFNCSLLTVWTFLKKDGDWYIYLFTKTAKNAHKNVYTMLFLGELIR